MEASAAEASNSADPSESKLIKIKVKTLGQASYDLEVESAVSFPVPFPSHEFDALNFAQVDHGPMYDYWEKWL